MEKKDAQNVMYRMFWLVGLGQIVGGAAALSLASVVVPTSLVLTFEVFGALQAAMGLWFLAQNDKYLRP